MRCSAIPRTEQSPRRLLTQLLLCLILACLGSISKGDTYPRREGIDVLNYRFELTLNDTSDQIEGNTTVTLRVTREGVDVVPLDLADPREAGRGMEVSSVRMGSSNLPFSHRNDLLNIQIPPVEAGRRLELQISYRGIPAGGLRIGPNRHNQRTFFSDNWPNRARQWLPTIDHPGDKATNEFVVTAPAHYQVVSNGLMVEETDAEGGMRITHWKNSVPISPWLYVLGVARFAVQRVGEFRGKPIQTWVATPDREAGFYDFAIPTKRVLEFYADRIGPFAYEKLANVTSPATGGGMEAASAIMYSESAVTGERSKRWRNVIIHEVAHQWFGNSVTESDWDDVWLSEGFATYFTLLFIEHAYGRDEFVAGLKSAADRVWRWYESNPNYRIVHDNLDDMSSVTSGATYQKGAWVLHMLRSLVGDKAFWQGVRRYYAEHMNANASTEDFRRAMEEASGIPLGDFFRRWLYEGGNPRVEGSWTYDSASRTVELSLKQSPSAGGLFDLPLEVGVFLPDDALPRLEKIRLQGASQLFRFSVEAKPREMVLDPRTQMLIRSQFGPR